MEFDALLRCFSSASCLVTQSTSGLIIGLLRFLTASGLTLVFGVLGIANFAHGAFYAVAAYCTYAVTAALGHMGWALLLGPLLTAALAVGHRPKRSRGLARRALLHRRLQRWRLRL